MTTLHLKCTKVIDLNASFYFTEGGEHFFHFDDQDDTGFTNKWYTKGQISTNLGVRVVVTIGKYTGKEFYCKDRNEEVIAYFAEV